MANQYNTQNPQGSRPVQPQQYQQQYQQAYQQQYRQPAAQQPYPAQQPVYRGAPVQQVQYVAPAPVTQVEAVTTGDWMLSMFLTAIPFVGLVLLFVWAFSSGTNISKSNWAKATLLWQAIAIAVMLALTLTGVIGVGFLSAYYG